MFEGLNPEQIEAVTTEKNTLVIACPGSGKTRVLTSKIAYELDRMKTKKKFIVALTFTNRAAEEIQKRLDEMGIPQDQLWAGTIHSFCYQWIIKPYSCYEPDLVNGFSIIDDTKKEKILSEMKLKRSLPVWGEISTSLNRMGEYINNDSYNNDLAKEFHHAILENKEIDFDLLLYYSYKLINNHQKIRQHLSNLISYIFVDEYQDTQDLQYGIIGKIIDGRNTCKLFLVGDPDQAIYGSLGGTPRSIEEIRDEIGQEEIEFKKISGNYRSTQRIVDFFTNFQSTDVEVQALGPHSWQRGLITLNKTIDKNDLFSEFAKIIRNNLDNGVKPNEICIIAPVWYFLTPLVKKLRSLLPDVPFEAPIATPLPRNRENFWWKLTRIFLTDISPETSLNRFRWIKQVIQEINIYTNNSLNVEQLDCRRYLKIVNRIKPHDDNAIKYLQTAFNEFFKALDIEFVDNPVLFDQWNSFFNGLEARYESDNFKDISKNIKYLKSTFKQSKGVVVNSCHGVKGEEFETVIAFGLLWGNIPNWSSIINQPYYVTKSASYNLLYVIGSRAITNLHLFAETGRTTKSRKPYKINEHLDSLLFDYDIEHSI
ncbi:ATP-dependent helicase [Rossellomorea oryzaecorticis]|uniref:ATP-dependent helicase n=1 Tax=Rossellomorea oryzaecorticis TaxID=1396505 RepID=A0ABU9K505_9BACI